MQKERKERKTRTGGVPAVWFMPARLLGCTVHARIDPFFDLVDEPSA
jgi:hypothetical protein